MDTRAQSGLGGGIFLGVVGAILYFAVSADISGIDINVVGGILMIAGALLAGFGLISALTATRSDGTVRTYTRKERIDSGAANYGILGTIAIVLLILVLLSILL